MPVNEKITARESRTLKKEAIGIVRKLRTHGYKAYLVGGCVRDMLLKKTSPDYDIASNATPGTVRKLFRRTIAVGEQFGVMIVMIGDHQFQVATFRSDHGIADGRHPELVLFTNEKEDVLRRDFTINGLLYDPIQRRVMDYVEGRKDLKRHLIRTIGNPMLRFEEDKLRMIRAIRFAARFGFRIAPPTLAAIRKRHKTIAAVSAERIREELTKILMGPKPSDAFELLRKTGLLAEILPEIGRLKGVRQPRQFHPEGDVWKHTMLMLDMMKRPSIELAWGTLLHDIGKPNTQTRTNRIRFNNHPLVGSRMTERICRRLKFSNNETDAIVALVRDHLKFIEATKMRESTLKRFLRDPLFALHLQLHYVDCMGSHKDLSIYRFCQRQLRLLKKEKIPVKLLISGHDIIRLGLRPSPIFKTILNEIENLQLEKKIQTREGALTALEKIIAEVKSKNPLS